MLVTKNVRFPTAGRNPLRDQFLGLMLPQSGVTLPGPSKTEIRSIFGKSHQTVVTELKAHHLRTADEGFGQVPWVFYNSTGGPLRRSHFPFNDFKPILKAADLHDVRFHDSPH